MEQVCRCGTAQVAGQVPPGTVQMLDGKGFWLVSCVFAAARSVCMDFARHYRQGGFPRRSLFEQIP